MTRSLKNVCLLHMSPQCGQEHSTCKHFINIHEFTRSRIVIHVALHVDSVDSVQKQCKYKQVSDQSSQLHKSLNGPLKSGFKKKRFLRKPVFFKKSPTQWVLGFYWFFLDKQEKIGKIIQKLSNSVT